MTEERKSHDSIKRPSWWRRRADINVWELRFLRLVVALNALDGLLLLFRGLS